MAPTPFDVPTRAQDHARQVGAPLIERTPAAGVSNPAFPQFFIFAVVSLVVLACQPADQSKEEMPEGAVKIIAVPELPSEEVEFQHFIEKVDIIPLETSDESLFGDVFDFIHQNNKFYVFDRFIQELFVFNEGGKFLYKLDKKGKGPEEYLDMRDFEINDQGDLYILSYKKILIYDSLRRLKKTISLTSLLEDYLLNPTMFALSFDNGYYLYVGAFGLRKQTPDRYSVYKVDGNGVFHGEAFFPVINNGAESPRFFKLIGEKNYTFTPILGNDTVYRFTPDKVYPAYYLDYGERKLPPELYAGFGLGKERFEAGQTTDFVTHTFSIIETSDFLSYSFIARKSNIWVVFYSKSSGNSFCFPLFHDFGARDYFPNIRSGTGRQFYGEIYSHSLIASRKSGEFRRKFGYLANCDSLEATIDQLDENDNAAIMVVSLKDF